MEDTIQCQVCGAILKTQVSYKHLRHHGLTTKQYREMGYETLSPARHEQLAKLCRDRRDTTARLYSEKHPMFKGGGMSSQGYRIIYVAGRRVVEHRYVMEQKLGRALRPDEQIHHIDGNKLNNSVENLLLVSVHSHNSYHHSSHSKRLSLGTKAKELRAQGMFPTEIAKLLGINRTTVHRWIKAGII